MRRVTVFCDRCGKAFDSQSKEIDERNLKLVDYEGDTYDICPLCQERLQKWFDEGEYII